MSSRQPIWIICSLTLRRTRKTVRRGCLALLSLFRRFDYTLPESCRCCSWLRILRSLSKMDTKGFRDMGVWTESFATCGHIHAETSRDYLAARTALSLLAMSGRVQSALQNSAIEQRRVACVYKNGIYHNVVGLDPSSKRQAVDNTVW